MSPEPDYPDEEIDDDRLSNYRVTAYVEVETSEVLLAGRAEDAVEFHRAAVERVCDELGVGVAEFEILEVDELADDRGVSD